MKPCDFKFECGDLLRDRVTGLEGCVMVRAEYATGCHHYGIMPNKLKSDGTEYDWTWLDQSRLELVTQQAVEFQIDKTRTSGPQPCGPKA